MAFLRSPYIKFTAIDVNGNPLSGGKVHTYIAGTNTRADTWSDFGITKNQNPITLNDMGQANIFLTENFAYKYVIEDALGVPIDTQDNIISSLGGDDISSDILKNGTSTTTAVIPFAQGLSSALGISITTAFGDGSTLKIPDGSWIRPQTAQGSIYLTNGENPSTLNSVLHLTNTGSLLSCGDGVSQFGYFGVAPTGLSAYYYGLTGNSGVSAYDGYASVFSGNGSALALSANSARIDGGDSNLILNNTYASLYQAGSGFYIDSTGIKPQGIAAGTITADGNLGLDSNGYIVKATNPTESNRTVSSGLYNDGDGVLSIGTGGAGVATTFSISNGSGFIENNGVVTTVTWTGKTNIAVTNIAIQNITYISIDINGNVIQQATRWNPTEFSNNIVLGVVVHVNRVNVDAVNNEQSVMTNASQQVGDVLEGIGFVNIDGNIFGANGATLGITKTAGLVMNRGINWVNGGHENPHKLTLPVLSPVTALQYRMRDGTSSALNLTVVNPNIYDDGSAYGSAPAVPTNKFTVQRIYVFTSNNVKIQPGQAVYNSLAEAKANIQLEPFITEPSIASNGILRGFLCIQQGTTSLTDASKVFFISAGKFGGSTGVGGLSVSTLQNAYDNSTNPEILTNTDLGAVSIKRGSASDADAVLEILNGAGTTTARINGDGSATLSGALNMGASSLTNIGSAQFNNNATAYNTSLTVPSIYSSSTGGASYPFLEAGNLIISPRISGAGRDVIISALGTQADLKVDRSGNTVLLGTLTGTSASFSGEVSATGYKVGAGTNTNFVLDGGGVVPIANYALKTYVDTLPWSIINSGKSQDANGYDLNDLMTSGFYRGNNLTNTPLGGAGWHHIIVEVHSDVAWIKQTIMGFGGTQGGGGMYVRIKSDGVWGSWRLVFTADSTGGLTLPTGTATLAPLNIGAFGVTKTTPVTGDIWRNSSTGLRFYNGTGNLDFVFNSVNNSFTGTQSFNAISATGTITSRQLATTRQTSATSTGSITWTLSSGGQMDLTTALTGAITMNITAPTNGGWSALFLTQGATLQNVVLSLTGVTWIVTGANGLTSTNTITLPSASFAVSKSYCVQLYWSTTTRCYVTIV